MPGKKKITKPQFKFYAKQIKKTIKRNLKRKLKKGSKNHKRYKRIKKRLESMKYGREILKRAPLVMKGATKFMPQMRGVPAATGMPFTLPPPPPINLQPEKPPLVEPPSAWMAPPRPRYESSMDVFSGQMRVNTPPRPSTATMSPLPPPPRDEEQRQREERTWQLLEEYLDKMAELQNENREMHRRMEDQVVRFEQIDPQQDQLKRDIIANQDRQLAMLQNNIESQMITPLQDITAVKERLNSPLQIDRQHDIALHDFSTAIAQLNKLSTMESELQKVNRNVEQFAIESGKQLEEASKRGAEIEAFRQLQGTIEQQRQDQMTRWNEMMSHHQQSRNQLELALQGANQLAVNIPGLNESLGLHRYEQEQRWKEFAEFMKTQQRLQEERNAEYQRLMEGIGLRQLEMNRGVQSLQGVAEQLALPAPPRKKAIESAELARRKMEHNMERQVAKMRSQYAAAQPEGVLTITLPDAPMLEMPTPTVTLNEMVPTNFPQVGWRDVRDESGMGGGDKTDLIERNGDEYYSIPSDQLDMDENTKVVRGVDTDYLRHILDKYPDHYVKREIIDVEPEYYHHMNRFNRLSGFQRSRDLHHLFNNMFQAIHRNHVPPETKLLNHRESTIDTLRELNKHDAIKHLVRNWFESPLKHHFVFHKDNGRLHMHIPHLRGVVDTGDNIENILNAVAKGGRGYKHPFTSYFMHALAHQMGDEDQCIIYESPHVNTNQVRRYLLLKKENAEQPRTKVRSGSFFSL